MNKRGQTTIEYATMLAMFLIIAFVLVILLSALNNYGWRILSLVGLDYP
jgi:hypothetical protein